MEILTILRIVIETRIFEKAGDASDYFSKMLNSYSIGDRLSVADASDLKALLNRHDELAEKVGNGIAYFEVNFPPDGYAGQCFSNCLGKIDCLKRKPLRLSKTLIPYRAMRRRVRP